MWWRVPFSLWEKVAEGRMRARRLPHRLETSGGYRSVDGPGVSIAWGRHSRPQAHVGRPAAASKLPRRAVLGFVVPSLVEDEVPQVMADGITVAVFRA